VHVRCLWCVQHVLQALTVTLLRLSKPVPPSHPPPAQSPPERPGRQARAAWRGHVNGDGDGGGGARQQSCPPALRHEPRAPAEYEQQAVYSGGDARACSQERWTGTDGGGGGGGGGGNGVAGEFVLAEAGASTG
jgi:hypothetical protein